MLLPPHAHQHEDCAKVGRSWEAEGVCSGLGAMCSGLGAMYSGAGDVCSGAGAVCMRVPERGCQLICVDLRLTSRVARTACEVRMEGVGRGGVEGEEGGELIACKV